jgi:hypothetical protein
VKRTVKLPATTAEYHPATHGGWAGCNIYWDGSKLTFDDVGETAHQYYQGVFFKWGSLWGLDPSYSNWSTTKKIYVPAPASATGWSSTTSCTENEWDEYIPYAEFTIIHTRTRLYEEHNPLAGKGDICRYITETNGGALHGRKWRMPTSAELDDSDGAMTDWTITGTFSLNDYTSNNLTDGTYEINSGYMKYGNIFFPASGIRYSNYDAYRPGSINNTEMTGNYWSSTTHAKMLFFKSDNINMNDYYHPSYACSVRCISEQ